MSSSPDFTLYTTKGLPPNGWKAIVVLEELGLNYKLVNLDFGKNEHKAAEYTAVNPNGRVPALIDHKNGDFIVWESGALITYLVEKYDAGHKISFDNYAEKIQQLQWLFFQASGQGPYYGQAGWYMLFATEKIPSALERYQKEVLRVLGVLDSVLSKKEWLVGDKCSVADLSFITWNHLATIALVKDYNGFDLEKDFPAVYRWHNAMLARPAVKKVFEMWKATQ